MSAGAAGPAGTQVPRDPSTPGPFPLQGLCTCCSLRQEHSALLSPPRVAFRLPLNATAPSPATRWHLASPACARSAPFVPKALVVLVNIYSQSKHHLLHEAILTSSLLHTGPVWPSRRALVTGSPWRTRVFLHKTEVLEEGTVADGALLPQHSHAAVTWGNFCLILPAREKAVYLHSSAPPLSSQTKV